MVAVVTRAHLKMVGVRNNDEDEQSNLIDDGSDCSTGNSPFNLSNNQDYFLYGDDEIDDSQVMAVNRRQVCDAKLTLSWTNICVTTSVKENTSKTWPWTNTNRLNNRADKRLLNNVCGSVQGGQLLAIMGSSGSGKTTLLNTLNGRHLKDLVAKGSVRLSCECPDELKGAKSSFVQQEDLFIDTLTVKEYLTFQAMVRLAPVMSTEERQERVNSIICDLDLSKCVDTRIGSIESFKGLSGGEMKRLSFAAEVLDNPEILICDEPTSGLDSFMALKVVQVLRRMANQGKIVICTIHQPSSEVYSMFDRLLLLANGRVAFHGQLQEAETFFAEIDLPCPVNYNPADFYMATLASPVNDQIVCDKFEDKRRQMGMERSTKEVNSYSRTLTATTTRSQVPWLRQFRALTWRSSLTISREPLLCFVRFVQILVISLLLGAIYYKQELSQDGVKNINGAIYLILMLVTFQNLFAVISVFCAELPLFLREHSSGLYRTSSYFMSKTLAELPVFILQPFLICTIVYFMIDLYEDIIHYLICCFVVILVANVVASFGYLISCISSSCQMALTIGTPTVIPLLIFGGFFIKNNTMPWYLDWIQYLSWFHHGFEALALNQWIDVNDISCSNNTSFCLSSGEAVIRFLHFKEDNFNIDLAFLVGLLTTFRLLAFVALSIRSKEKR